MRAIKRWRLWFFICRWSIHHTIKTSVFFTIMMHSSVIAHSSSVQVTMSKGFCKLERCNLLFWEFKFPPFGHRRHNMYTLFSCYNLSFLQQTNQSQPSFNFLSYSYVHLFNFPQMGIDLISINSWCPISTLLKHCIAIDSSLVHINQPFQHT